MLVVELLQKFWSKMNEKIFFSIKQFFVVVQVIAFHSKPVELTNFFISKVILNFINMLNVSSG